MSPRAHPSDETLLRFAAGRLPAASRLVVAVHLAGCPCCRGAVARFEAVGGALLDAQAPAALAVDALDRTLARLAPAPEPAVAGRSMATRRPIPAPAGLPPGFVLPAALAGCAVGPLRPVAPGTRVGRVTLPDDPAAQVLLLRLGPGRAIPDHTHGGLELTQVLLGSYHDRTGRYRAGDLVEADGALTHTPRVDEDGECICLVALEGALRFSGLLGVVLRPFL